MPSLFRKYLIGISILLTSTLTTVSLSNAASAVVDNSPDCDNVAIIRCGAFDMDTMRQKASQDDVPKIFNHVGISQNDLKGQFVDGIVWRDGRVTVGDKVVATNAMTAGRNFGGTPIEGTNAGVYSTSKFVTEGQTAFVKMKADGTFDFAVIKACGNPVKAAPKQPVKPEQPKPTYECVSLKAEKLSRTKYKFIAQADTTGDAQIEKYEFGFGDGFGITVSEDDYTYDYKKTGTFETSVVVHVKVNGEVTKVTSPQCKTNVTVVPENTPEVCPYNNALPKDSPDCKQPEEKCPIKGKEDLPKDSEQCKEDEVATPAVISATGPGSIIGGLAGSSILGYGAYTYAQSRRLLLSKHLSQ